ncbi:MAG: hypothetical protein JST86_20060 [Bacteroidetes bacterium]|nr:hypothetical protein [Bacteroidota bacterium]
MTENRPVPFKLLFAIFKTKYPFSGIGLVFITLSIFIFIPVIAFFNSIKDAYEKYDYEKIVRQGKDLKAIVTSVQTQNNVTVNNVYHPQIIDYAFSDNEQTKNDKFKTLTNAEKLVLQIGDTINIKTYNGESVIENLEPFSFPINRFYILPLIFLLIGIPFFLIGLFPVLKHYRLYKNGIRKEATIISLTTTGILPVVSMTQNVLVNYFYVGQYGNKILDKSISSGLYLMTEKKVQDKIDIFVSSKDESISCIVPKALL